MAGERGSFVAHALHEATVAGDHEHVMIDHRFAEGCPKMFFGNRHSHRVGESLTERTRGHLDTRGVAHFRMAGVIDPSCLKARRSSTSTPYPFNHSSVYWRIEA